MFTYCRISASADVHESAALNVITYSRNAPFTGCLRATSRRRGGSGRRAHKCR